MTVTRGSNVIELFPKPAGFNVTDEAWTKVPPALAIEICRSVREMRQGIAIAKDRRCGRPKSHRRPEHAQGASFYALHLLELEIARNPGDAALQARREALAEALAPDLKRIALDDELAPFHEMAERSGKTLADVLRQYIAIESRLRADPIKELRAIAKNAGLDIEAWARRVLEADVA